MPGSQVRGCTLTEKVGSDGSNPYLAVGPNGLPVFIRLSAALLGDAGHAEAVLQFLGRYRRLNHRALVKVHDFWVEGGEGGRLVLVTELAEGSLRGRLGACHRAGLAGIPRDELLGCFHDAAEGLDYLHSEHVLHRDIKPDNLLLRQGRAHLDVPRLPDGRSAFALTPLYAAPEALRGEENQQSDQYSLAASYVELRLGRPLFLGALMDLGSIIKAQLEREPDLDPMPSGERDVLRRALAKHAGQRYPNCLTFVRELDRASGRLRQHGPQGTNASPASPAAGPGPHSLSGHNLEQPESSVGEGDPGQPRPPRPRARTAAIGHHDHGMSTLTAAVVARQAHKNGLSRFPTYQDITRGGTQRDEFKTVTWAPRHVEYMTPGWHYDHYDCPGLLDTVKNTITVLAETDSAILVVAADDGPMPQTREHLVLARQGNVASVVVFLSKADAVDDPELLALVEREVREALRKYGFPADSVPIVRGNALAAMLSGGKDDRACAPIDALMDALDTAAAGLVRERDKPFLMSVDDVFSIKGRGTVGTGRIERGQVKVGDEVQIVGLMKQPRQTVVTGVDIFNKAVEYATAGDDVGVLLRGIGRTDLDRGQVLAKPGSVTAHTKFEAGVSILTREEGGRGGPVFSGYQPQFYFRTTDVTGTLTLPPGVEMGLPGDNLKVTVELHPDMPLAIDDGQQFALRAGGCTVGFGVVTKVVG